MKIVGILMAFSCSFLSADGISSFITHRQKKCIETILYSLSEKSTGSLVFDAFHLRSIGKEIDVVPPLDFLHYVLQKPTLVKYLKNTRKRYFQWNAFISGFKDKCNKPKIYSEINDSLNVFADLLGLEVKELKPFIANRNWEGFVKYLLKRR